MDLNNMVVTKLSSKWVVDEYYCKTCLHSATLSEYVAGTCTSCGSLFNSIQGSRVYRRVYVGQKWVYQYKYPSGRTHIREKLYK